MSPSPVVFFNHLERSSVLDSASLQGAKQLLAEGRFTDARAIADELVRRRVLTPFQADSLLRDAPPLLVIGNYVLLAELGQGGMGQVYFARHRILKRPVALKTISSALVGPSSHLARFLREAEAAGRLEHPNIVATYDADEHDGIHFLAMQYIEGCTLDQLVLRRGPLAIDDALALIMQTAQGLAYAHEHGVVHRDIKPSNLILGTDGVLRILDMGLAQTGIFSEVIAESETFVPMGSVDFLAPEQGLPDALADPRSDLYSVGCTLHFLLTGLPMYRTETPVERLLAHRSRPAPSLRTQRAEVSIAIDAVFQKLVAKKPADRFQSAQELVDAIQSCVARLKEPRQLKDLLPDGEAVVGGSLLLMSDQTEEPEGSEDTTAILVQPENTADLMPRWTAYRLAASTLVLFLATVMLVPPGWKSCRRLRDDDSKSNRSHARN